MRLYKKANDELKDKHQRNEQNYDNEKEIIPKGDAVLEVIHILDESVFTEKAHVFLGYQPVCAKECVVQRIGKGLTAGGVYVL